MEVNSCYPGIIKFSLNQSIYDVGLIGGYD